MKLLSNNKIPMALGVAIAATIASATTVAAAGKSPSAGVAQHSVNRQMIEWRSGSGNRVYTASKSWSTLPMPSGGCVVGQHGCSQGSFSSPILFAKGPISLTFSGVFSGATVELRFRDGRVMRPGAVGFRPEPANHSFSFTFVSPRKGKRLCEGPSLQWRSPSGQQVRLNKATVEVDYKQYVPSQQTGCA